MTSEDYIKQLEAANAQLQVDKDKNDKLLAMQRGEIGRLSQENSKLRSKLAAISKKNESENKKRDLMTEYEHAFLKKKILYA